eukprot:scaffold91147_cov71-Phaeocystis_antarctica.AAC.1
MPGGTRGRGAGRASAPPPPPPAAPPARDVPAARARTPAKLWPPRPPPLPPPSPPPAALPPHTPHHPRTAREA